VVAAAGDAVEGQAVVVGEEIVVAAVEGVDRFGDQGRRIHRTVVVVPGLRRPRLRDHHEFVEGEPERDRPRIDP